MKLDDFFLKHRRVALGFSGGVDSAYLLYAGLRLGADIRAYYIKTAFQPAFELRDARLMAERLGTSLTVLELDVLADDVITANPNDRCYHCKKALFGHLRRHAEADGYSVLIDGTNASDDAGDRPGMRAIAELSVYSPLRECDLTKDGIRSLSKEAGLFTWNKPAYACLATRVPANRPITKPLLMRVEAAEEALFALGFHDFRVRVCGEAARIQISEDELRQVFEQHEEIVRLVKPYFPVVLLDMEMRRNG